MATPQLDGIVLDLDDTLIDTTRLLLPAADRRAARALVDGGAVADAATLTARFHTLRARGESAVFRVVAGEQGLAEAAADAADTAFFRYDFPDLALRSEVAAALDELATRAPLALLTFGDPETQRRKIEVLGLERWLSLCEIVARGAGRGKTAALRELLDAQDWRADRVVVCGDNPGSEIRAANACGCTSVLVRRPGAEFAGAPTSDARDRPDHMIASITALPALLDILPTV